LNPPLVTIVLLSYYLLPVSISTRLLNKELNKVLESKKVQLVQP